MARVPSILLGNYGNGTIGLKCSISPYDVTDLADDNNAERRSFNSEWTNLCKIKLIGVAVAQPRQYQAQSGGGASYVRSESGWIFDTPILVATGLAHMPIWEERLYNPATHEFCDDKAIPTFSGPYFGSSVGRRSHFPGTGSSYSNMIIFEPYINSGRKNPVFNFVYGASNVPPWPPYPDYPARPDDQYSAYVVYANKLGDVS